MPPTSRARWPRRSMSASVARAAAWNSSHRELARRVDEVEEMVRHLGPGGRRRLGGADVHAAVDASSSRRRRARRRPAGGRPPWRRRTCRTRSSRAGRPAVPPGLDRRHRAGRRQPAATGMRATRCRGAAVSRPKAADQVVRRRAGHLDLGERPDRQPVAVGRGEVDELALPRPAGQHGRVPPARPFDEHLLGPADAALVTEEGGPLDDRPEPVEPFGDDVSAGCTGPPWPPPACPGRGEKMNVYALS